MSFLASVQLAPRDPILGITEQYNADTNPAKVNLGVGVYFDENGKLPLLQCVQKAEKQMAETLKPRGYLPIDGMAAYDSAVKNLVFGSDSAVQREGRVATVQALGGTGGLKIGADFLKMLTPDSKVLISDPSWENHQALFSRAGFAVQSYPYYDAASRGIYFDGMLDALRSAAAGSVVVLHACCHNPTGYDLSSGQWDQVVALLKSRQLIGFLDMAYQGFGTGLAQDGALVGKCLDAGIDFLIATSFSKSFSLYGERVGALSVVSQNSEQALRVLSQLKSFIRSNYSTPPTHGATIVTTVLNTPELRKLWEQELAGMRGRIKEMRQAFVQKLAAAGVKQDMGFITQQVGMFSYSGLSKDQMMRLRSEFGVYGTDTGRMCVAALNHQNIDYVCASIAKVF